MAVLGQFLQQISRTQKACSQQAVVGHNFVRQFLCCSGAQILGQQVHVQSQHVAGLRGAVRAFCAVLVALRHGRRGGINSGHKSVVAHKSLLECGANLVEQPRVLFLGMSAARRLRHLPHQRHVISPIGRRDQRVIGLPFRRKPVAEGSAGFVLPQPVRVGGFNGVEILLHCRPVLIDHAGVAGLQPRGPGNDHACIAPSRAGTGRLLIGARRKHAVIRRTGLCAAHVPGILARESGQIHIV